jgi:hypothetical protein
MDHQRTLRRDDRCFTNPACRSATSRTDRPPHACPRGVKKLQYPAGLIVPATIWQAFGGWKCAQRSQRLPATGWSWYATVCCDIFCAAAVFDSQLSLTAPPAVANVPCSSARRLSNVEQWFRYDLIAAPLERSEGSGEPPVIPEIALLTNSRRMRARYVAGWRLQMNLQLFFRLYVTHSIAAARWYECAAATGSSVVF